MYAITIQKLVPWMHILTLNLEFLFQANLIALSILFLAGVVIWVLYSPKKQETKVTRETYGRDDFEESDPINVGVADFQHRKHAGLYY